jgi:hypothetical protein
MNAEDVVVAPPAPGTLCAGKVTFPVQPRGMLKVDIEGRC